MDNFNMDNPVDRWLTFLAEPEKLITMQKFDISVYPNLMKAVEILDRSNFTQAQQIAYDNHLFAVADINQTRIESFDKGYVEGRVEGRVEGIEEGREEGRAETIAILKDLQIGTLSHIEIAIKYGVELHVVIELAQTLGLD